MSDGALACPSQWAWAEAIIPAGQVMNGALACPVVLWPSTLEQGVGWRACLPNTVDMGGGHHTGQVMDGALACPTQWAGAEAM